MKQTFATLTHAAPKLNVLELKLIRLQLIGLKGLGNEFAVQADQGNDVHPAVVKNIDPKKREAGEIIFRLRQLAKERNINYTPSDPLMTEYNAYLEKTALTDPFDLVDPSQYPLSHRDQFQVQDEQAYQPYHQSGPLQGPPQAIEAYRLTMLKKRNPQPVAGVEPTNDTNQTSERL